MKVHITQLKQAPFGETDIEGKSWEDIYEKASAYFHVHKIQIESEYHYKIEILEE